MTTLARPKRACQAQPDPGDLQVLLLDRRRAQAPHVLRGWIGAEGAAHLLGIAQEDERYVLIATLDTRSAPRHLHFTELLTDIEHLAASLLDLGRSVGGMLAGSASVAMLELRLQLEPEDCARIDAAIDAHTAGLLYHVAAQGNA